MNISQLQDQIIKKKSPVVVGLDPRLDRIPEHYKKEKSIAQALTAFNKDIIDGVYEIVPAVKLQVAFYEKYGLDGLKAYVESKKYAKSKGLFVIGDIKRGDIGSTSKAYSNGHLGPVNYNGKVVNDFEVDNITVNPYLGEDCLKEFLEDINTHDKSIFVLVKTSNPSSKQIQDLISKDEKIYEHVASLVRGLNGDYKEKYGPIGAVVGATYPKQLLELREQMPKAYFLVPGYGAQGGGAKDVIHAFDSNGLGAIVNSSRGVIFNYEKTKTSVKEGARLAVVDMNNAINEALAQADKAYWV